MRLIDQAPRGGQAPGTCPAAGRDAMRRGADFTRGVCARAATPVRKKIYNKKSGRRSGKAFESIIAAPQ